MDSSHATLTSLEMVKLNHLVHYLKICEVVKRK